MYFLSVFISIHFICTVQSLFVLDAEFQRRDICNVSQLISDGCMVHQTAPGRSVPGCARQCAKEPLCLGFSVDSATKNMCYFHFECHGEIPIEKSCETSDDYYKFYPKIVTFISCQNGGIFNSLLARCDCVDSWMGSDCTERASTCRGIWHGGYKFSTRQYFEVQPPGFSKPLGVFCEVKTRDNNIRMYVIYNEGKLDFKKTWLEYTEGIFEAAIKPKELFVGLEAMHYFTHELGLDELMVYFEAKILNEDGFLRYKGLNIAGADTNYEAKYDDEYISSYIKNHGDGRYCIGNNTEFSTKYDDNDQDPGVHCASVTGSGWWFNTCPVRPLCNPLGRHYIRNDPGMEHAFVRDVNFDTDEDDRLARVRAWFVEPF